MAFRLPGATALLRGLVQLTGHLGGTAGSPTVVNFALSGNANANSHKITSLADGTDAGDAANVVMGVLPACGEGGHGQPRSG